VLHETAHGGWPLTDVSHPSCSSADGDQNVCYGNYRREAQLRALVEEAGVSGNVWEWVSDYYQVDYYYASPDVDPQGPEDGDQRSARGIFSFVYTPSGLFRATYRGPQDTLLQNTNPDVAGFRCARTAQ
jgi:formylglycine-generating enzyme required for sulfatase activity